MRDWLLFIHILSAALWIGGGVYAWFSGGYVVRSGGSAGRLVETLAKNGGKYFGPAAGLTLLSGIVLVWSQELWTWTDAFVLVGIGAFVFSAVYQPLVSQKTENRLVEAVVAGDDIEPAVRSANRVTAVELAVLGFALWSMVFKLGA